MIADRPAPPRTFVFLQGLASDFFGRLADRLAARGHRVIRVNLNGGDWLFWNRPDGVNFRGRAAHWPAFFADLVKQRGITDLVLFGDCRPLHRAAITVANEMRLVTHVVEEGYLRPDWITVEQGGVNGHSTLPRDPTWYRDLAATLPPVPAITAIPSSFRRRAFADLSYNISAMLLAWAYPFYRTHRPWHPAIEYWGWARRLLGRPWAERRAELAARRLEHGEPFFLFPLQLDCDSQIRLHSSFRGMREAIEAVLGSFATHAPADSLLVVKEHPLDNGLIDWRRAVADVAARHRLQDRLVYLEAGVIDDLVKPARGVVTVNSTTGTLALACNVPVITLGTAIYDLPGLTDQQGLDAFWHAPTPPDPALFDAFRRVLAHRCLVRGGFFSDRGLAMLTDGAVARLEAAERPRATHERVPAAAKPTFAPVSRQASALSRS